MAKDFKWQFKRYYIRSVKLDLFSGDSKNQVKQSPKVVN